MKWRNVHQEWERERERGGFSVSSIKFRTECGTTFHAYSLDTLWSTRQKQNCVSERVSEFGFTPRDTDCDDERWKGVGEEEEGGSLSPTSKSDKKVWKANAGRNNNIGTLEWLSDRQSVESMPFPGIDNSFGRFWKRNTKQQLYFHLTFVNNLNWTKLTQFDSRCNFGHTKTFT